MKKHQNLAATYSVFGSILLLFGTLFFPKIEFAPTIGWLGALVCFILAFTHALKANRLNKKSSQI